MSGTSERVSVWLGFALYLIGLFTLPIEIIYAQSELNRIRCGETARTPVARRCRNVLAGESATPRH